MTMTPYFCFKHTMILTPYVATTTAGNTITAAGATVTGIKCRLQLLDSMKSIFDGGTRIDYSAIIFCGPDITVSTGYTATIGTRIFHIDGVINQGSQPNVFQKKLLVNERKI